jgi:hypothetical protein
MHRHAHARRRWRACAKAWRFGVRAGGDGECGGQHKPSLDTEPESEEDEGVTAGRDSGEDTAATARRKRVAFTTATYIAFVRPPPCGELWWSDSDLRRMRLVYQQEILAQQSRFRLTGRWRPATAALQGERQAEDGGKGSFREEPALVAASEA